MRRKAIAGSVLAVDVRGGWTSKWRRTVAVDRPRVADSVQALHEVVVAVAAAAAVSWTLCFPTLKK